MEKFRRNGRHVNYHRNRSMLFMIQLHLSLKITITACSNHLRLFLIKYQATNHMFACFAMHCALIDRPSEKLCLLLTFSKDQVIVFSCNQDTIWIIICTLGSGLVCVTSVYVVITPWLPGAYYSPAKRTIMNINKYSSNLTFYHQ